MATPEQNEAVGIVALQQLDRRMKLLKTARGSSGRWDWTRTLIAFFSVPIILTVVDHFFPHTSYSMIIVLCLCLAMFVITLDINRAHSRIDALLQLVGEENLLNESVVSK